MNFTQATFNAQPVTIRWNGLVVALSTAIYLGSIPPAQAQERLNRGSIESSWKASPLLGVAVASSPGVGVLVISVAPNSSAAYAGIRAGDYILSVDDHELSKAEDLLTQMRNTMASTHVKLVTWSNGEESSLRIKLRKPQIAPRFADGPAFDGPRALDNRLLHNRFEMQHRLTDRPAIIYSSRPPAYLYSPYAIPPAGPYAAGQYPHGLGAHGLGHYGSGPFGIGVIVRPTLPAPVPMPFRASGGNSTVPDGLLKN